MPYRMSGLSAETDGGPLRVRYRVSPDSIDVTARIPVMEGIA